VAWLRDALRAKEIGVLQSRTPTLAEWFETYLTQVAEPKLRPLTLANYRRDMERHVYPSLGRLRLDQLQPHHVAELYRDKLKEGLSPHSIRHIHSVLRRGLTIAVRWGLLHRNVAQLVDTPPLQHAEIYPLDVAEARKLLAFIRGDRMEARWVVGLSMGLRQGETLGLWWDDIDFERGSLSVRRQLRRPPRTGEPMEFAAVKSARSRRVLPVPASVLEALRRHRVAQDRERLAADRWSDPRLVFATRYGTPIDHKDDRRSFWAVCRAAGIRQIRVHDLRHTAATLLIAQGQHPRVVMEILGHSQIAVTMNVYGHVLDENLRGAAVAMDQALWGSGS
jgi:integrase